jgi:hypothetical protein
MEATAVRQRSWWITVAIVVLVASLVVGALLLIRLWPPPTPAWGFPGFEAAIAISFGVMGAFIARRRPGNPEGPVLLAVGVASAVQFAVDLLPAAARASGLAGSPTEAWAAWLSNWIWIVPVAFAGPGFLLFPDGKPPSAAWGRLLPATAVAAIGLIAALATAPGTLGNFPTIDNPLPIGGSVAAGVQTVGFVLLAFVLIASAVSLVVRWRRSSGITREQLKWLAYVSLPMTLAFALSQSSRVAQYGVVLFACAVPVAVAIAIVRHRLYDIDQIINRTLVYGALTAVLAGLYTAALRLFNELFVQVTGASSESSIILATLVLAAAFTPIRKWLEGIVDRRFKSAPGDAAILSGTAVATLTAAELETLVRRAVREEFAAGARSEPGG